jgi:Domain of unknown function (DUF6457)
MSIMDDWITAARAELGIDLELDVGELLDVTKVVAHHVARPAAPLTAFLIGYAAAQAGGGPAEVSAASAKITVLAERQPARGSQDPSA